MSQSEEERDRQILDEYTKTYNAGKAEALAIINTAIENANLPKKQKGRPEG